MKNIILLIAFILIGSVSFAQTKVVKDSNGNYVVTIRKDSTDKLAGGNYIDRDKVSHPVYISKKGKLYYIKTSKAGKEYKSYITVNVD